MDPRASLSGRSSLPPTSLRSPLPLGALRLLLPTLFPVGLTALGFALLTGCGLPNTLPGLVQPGGVLTTLVSGSVFQFNNTIPNPSYTLLGFELYYKLYDNSSSGALGAYQADTTQFTSSIYATPGYAPLTSEGYRRLVVYPSSTSYPVIATTYSGNSGSYLSAPQVQTLQQAPAIPITSSEATSLFIVKIDGRSLSTTGSQLVITGQYTSGSQITFADGSQTLYGARLLIPTSGSLSIYNYLKGFNSGSSFDTLDPDMQTILSTDSNPTTIAIGLVVLAYGLDPNINQVYSIPVPIGFVSIPVTQVYTG